MFKLHVEMRGGEAPVGEVECPHTDGPLRGPVVVVPHPPHEGCGGGLPLGREGVERIVMAIYARAVACDCSADWWMRHGPSHESQSFIGTGLRETGFAPSRD